MKRTEYLSRFLLVGSFISLLLIAPESMGQVTPDPNGTDPSEARKKAMLIFQRLTGVKTPLDDPRLDEMESKINGGDSVGAAAVATLDSNFYNITVRNFAAKMSTREETIKTSLNDFQATVVGAVRDGLNAKTLLTGDYFYRGRDGLAGVQDNLVTDILRSNNHYQDIERRDYKLDEVLVKVDGQSIVNGANQAVKHPEPAGLLTTRAFMAAHASAGTNRRVIEHSVKQFLCLPIEKWADASSPDNMVGRDVDRQPGGDPIVYQNKCSGCHGVMDSLRPAVSYFDFEDEFTKHSSVLPSGDDDSSISADNNGVVNKMNRNADVYPNGYEITQPSWVNNATTGENGKYFGWRGPTSGSGFSQFASMLAESEAFSRCMAQRVYKTVCKREVSTGELPLVKLWGKEFEAENYNLKKLFEKVGASDACLGES